MIEVKHVADKTKENKYCVDSIGFNSDLSFESLSASTYVNNPNTMLKINKREVITIKGINLSVFFLVNGRCLQRINE